jgi:hypothetical protein
MKTELPTEYRNILALVKYQDFPAFPAAGYMARTSDTHEPYLSVFLPKGTGYDWSLVINWVYIDDLIKGFTVPVKEGEE